MATIRIQQPQPYDIVDDPLLVAGLSVAFEATVQWELNDGHDELQGFFTGGGGTSVRQFQTSITGIEDTAMKQALMFLTLFELSARDGSRINEVTVPVIYGPFLVAGFEGYRDYVVQPGDTLSSIAVAHYGDASQWPRIQTANQHIVPNPNLIFSGQQLRLPIGS